MRNWTNDDRMMIACCNDGTRPVIFKIERIDIPETEEEKEWLEKQNFKNSADDAYRIIRFRIMRICCDDCQDNRPTVECPRTHGRLMLYR